jgi:hypothetical protein
MNKTTLYTILTIASLTTATYTMDSGKVNIPLDKLVTALEQNKEDLEKNSELIEETKRQRKSAFTASLNSGCSYGWTDADKEAWDTKLSKLKSEQSELLEYKKQLCRAMDRI